MSRHGISRRKLITGAAVVAGGLAINSNPAQAKPRGRKIVADGLAQSVVVTSDDAPAGVTKAAAEFVSYVARATGITLPTASLPSSPPDSTLAPIYIGFIGPRSGSEVAGHLVGLDRDGFVIAPHGSALTIIGPGEWGTLNGVYEFLERFAGISWLMPTAIGEDIPSVSSIAGPTSAIRQTPAFIQRMMSPMTDQPGTTTGTFAPQYQWAQRNRIQGKYNQAIAFHHNLYSLFPVSEFGTTHPEYYGGGKVPAPGVTTYWQPAFTVPGTIDVAVTKIKAYFAANPNVRSFSLGVNDGGGFVEPDPVAAYYGWVNEVVSRVLVDYPDKWFGLLAYVELEEPPTFALNSRVVPFFTQDRYAWADPTVEAASKSELDAWSNIASQIGFYDYTYGSPYLVPRVYPHLDAAVYSYAKNTGIIAHYHELYPNWGEGPKPWIHAKLMWNPDQNVDTLLTSWYTKAVGAGAAPYLAQYFELWESFWTERAISSSWFRPGATYQAFNSGAYLNALTAADIQTSRNLINSVLANPGTAAQQARAAKLAKAFEYYEASAQTFPRDIPAPTTSSAALAILTNVESTWQVRRTAAQRRMDLLTEFKTDPLLIQPLDAVNYGLIWGAWNRAEFWGVVDYLRANESSGGPVTDWLLARQGTTPASEFTQFVRLALGLKNGQLTSLLANGSFESSTAPWTLWVASTGQLLRDTTRAHSGSSSLLARKIVRGGPAQVVNVQPGLIATRCYVFAPAGGQYNGSVQFNINLQNSAGTQLGVIRANAIRVSTYAGQWFTVDSLDSIPQTVNGQAVAKVQYVLVLDAFNNDPDIFIDDIAIYQAPAG